MFKGLFKYQILLFCVLALMGCASQPVVEVGYKPPIAIPIRVSVNTQGEINVGLSGELVTPIGTFDISGDAAINSLRNQYSNKVLIVRLDDQAVVYQLEEGKEFKVDFDDSNTLYKKVALKYESNGDIVLELESVKQGGLGPAKEPDSATVPSQSDHSYVTISCAEDITQASLRKTPGYSNKDDTKDIIYKVDCGQKLQLIGESRQADGLTWWKVSWSGYIGWMADHTASGRTILVFE